MRPEDKKRLARLARPGEGEEEDRLWLARLADAASRSERDGRPEAVGFLDPSRRVLLEGALEGEAALFFGLQYAFFGGYEEAERTLLILAPDYIDPLEAARGEIAALRAESTPFDPPMTHRDVLGSVMGLGVTRERVGDILIGGDGRSADLLLAKEIAPFALENLKSVGRARVKASPIALSELRPAEKKTALIRDTLSSLRLDGLLAGGFSLSRAEAAELIRAGAVSLNHRPCLKPDERVEQGDLVSLRGGRSRSGAGGRIVLHEVGPITKKGKQAVTIMKYL